MSNFKPPFAADMTLKDAQDILRELLDKGERCPTCTQFAKVYRRTLPSASARILILLYHNGGRDDYVHLPTLMDRTGIGGTAHQGGYGTLSVNWGLLERQPGRRDDGSDRVGWWKLTARGIAFVEGRAMVQKYARLYNGRCLGLTGKHIDIKAALGKRFNYSELMAGV